MTYLVAAEGVQVLSSKSSTRVPVGVIHGYEEGTSRTLCEKFDLSELSLFSVPFLESSMLKPRCPDCEQRALA